MSWQIELPLIVRSFINDLDPVNPTFTDDRLQQLIVVAAQYVQREIDLPVAYQISIVCPDIVPDPTILENRDKDFISFVALKSVCLLDQSSLRTRAALDGVRANLGPAGLSVTSSSSYQFLLVNGPCKSYEDLRMDYALGNVSLLRGILSPFIGNKFEGKNLRHYTDHRSGYFYS